MSDPERRVGEEQVAEPFIGEIRIVSFGFAPRGWATCDGQLLPINQNQALFSLLGTTYGGNGQITFALPDLRGRAPVHVGSHTQGERGGEEQHTLIAAEMPTHAHDLMASSTDGDSAVAQGHVLARRRDQPYLPPPASLQAMRAGTVANVGGGQAHTNLQPYLVLNFCVALQGIFPSRN